MIVFDLICSSGHRFEGWFGSSAQFSQQCERDLVVCPRCGDTAVAKAPMAPAVGAKGNKGSAVASRGVKGLQRKPVIGGNPAPELIKAMQVLAKAQAKALEGSTWVGDAFAEKSRAIHYGEAPKNAESGPIHGRATAEDAKALIEEGIAIAPLPFPIAPPDELN